MDSHNLPVPSIRVRERNGRFFYEAMFRYDGKQVGRRVGPAWLESDRHGGFRKRKGKIEPGYFDDRTVHVRAAEIVARYVSGEEEREREARDKELNGPIFRDVAASYMSYVEHVKDATPATLRGYRSLLAEPGAAFTRGRGGSGVKQGRIMKALGDRPAAHITTLEINNLLNSIAETGVSAKTVTRSRQILSAIFYYGMKDGNGFDLPKNPVANAHRRTIAPSKPLVYYKPADIEAIATAFEAGAHRDRPPRSAWDVEDDRRDAELVRVAAYTGLRLGELRELRWRDINWERSAITVSRSLSAGVEREGTKSRRNRAFGLPQQAADALRRLSQRARFTGPDHLVFCSPIGRRIDDAALRKRYKKAQAAAGVAPIRLHDLRHSFGSLLAAGGVDLVNIQSAMGHSQIETTMIYMHAKNAKEQADMFTKALASGTDRPRPPMPDQLQRRAAGPESPIEI